MYYMLLYDYVEDVGDKRAPYRAAHLDLLEGLVRQGEVVMGGAWTDPLDGAAIVFKAQDRSAVEAFVRTDPYVANGLVTSWRVREWNVVIGGE